jgi:hypothetical protein
VIENNVTTLKWPVVFSQTFSTHILKCPHFDYWHVPHKTIKIKIHLEMKVCPIELKRQLAGEKN